MATDPLSDWLCLCASAATLMYHNTTSIQQVSQRLVVAVCKESRMHPWAPKG